MKVLIVDDEQLVRWFMERALKRKGYQVFTASNIEEASRLIEGENFDIVFTDLKMPEGNGSVLVSKLCEITNKPHVIVCSAYITPDLDHDLKKKGVLTLKKPFKLNELEDTLNKLS
jgi:DNA-binding NtrC family response regulator